MSDDLADWSNLPKDIYVIGARSDGIAFDVSCCSVPMVTAPEVRYTRADLAMAHIRKLEAALEWYANPQIYKPHPHGPAFDDRDLSFRARAALERNGMSDGQILNPGSDLARSRGCTCPVIDNHYGEGVPSSAGRMFWHNGACPMHGFQVASKSLQNIKSGDESGG